MDEGDTFGSLLKKARETAALTQAELAAAASVSINTVSVLERGLYLPGAGNLKRLANALKFTEHERQAFLRVGIGGDGRSTLVTRVVVPPRPTTWLANQRDEIAALVGRLAGGARLVTVTGPPGVGKSRLALEAVRGLDDAFPDGIAFADLAELRDPALVMSGIATAVGVGERGTLPLRAQLAADLRERRLPLVLDNVDPVVEAAGEIVGLLADAPPLQVLTTSRVVLSVTREELFPVSPLDLAAAAGLFTERARAVATKPSSPPPDAAAEAATVREICERLDGLPLAIELAAGLRFLTPAEVLARLDARLRLLARGSRDLPARQRGLRAVLDESHERLTPEERIVFRRLAAFHGGWAREDAEAVCDPADGAARLGVAVPVILGALADKSLVRVAGEGGPDLRFSMFGTINEYAAARLRESGEERDILRRHAEHYLRLLATAYALVNAYDPVTLSWLERESANLGATIDWTLAYRDGSVARYAILALQNYWAWSGRYTEGRARLRALLALPGGDPLLRIYALCGAAKLACEQGDLDEADALGEQSLALAREHGDDYQAALAINALGEVARARGDHVVAVARFEECLSGLLALPGAEVSDPTLYSHIATVLLNFGWSTAALGDQEEARILFDEALELARANADTRVTAHALHDLGRLANLEGARDRSRALYDASLALARRIDDRHTVALDTFLLGRIALDMGDAAGARRLLEESLTLYRALGDARRVALITADLAALTAASPASEHDNATLEAEGEKPGG